ncbi:hypothetical protein CKK33_11770 [Mucilaginibacter sp. MD40]|uniref:hypothetical protein n=1 Tax=Mucilaginibacter sp. MD40 TaxID=2029590 RepID=UPI000BAC5D51|nr:hypothetical protein [Mucilaginibacter sp. MD40]PAW94135.1 hypothetical protein CKK33_11770 [Mucilaginibacter sp. MD40]
MKILITAATSADSHKLKKQFDGHVVQMGDYHELPAFMNVVKLPDPKVDTYAHEMLTLCLDIGAEQVYLMEEAEADALLPSGQLFTEYNIELIDGRNL